MFRIVFRALLPVISALLTYQAIFAAVPESIFYKQTTISDKSMIMSNISMALYLAVRNFIPKKLVPDKNEWLNIDGSADQYPPGEKYSPMNSDLTELIEG